MNLNQHVEIKEIELGLVGPKNEDKSYLIPYEVSIEGGLSV
jgi:hypothetical protein